MKTSNKSKVTPSEHQAVLKLDQEALLQSLVRQVATSQESKLLPINELMVNEVILESDVDGVHYCLVRCCPQSQEKINLSPREQAIAKLVAQGFPNKLIGSSLHISPWTVATHIRRIFVKLGVSSRTAMITRLLESNLLHLND